MKLNLDMLVECVHIELADHVPSYSARDIYIYIYMYLIFNVSLVILSFQSLLSHIYIHFLKKSYLEF